MCIRDSSLIERAEHLYDAEQAKQMEKKLSKGQFDFEDFLDAMNQMRKLGPFQQILGMIPGMGQFAQNEELINEKRIKRVEAIILSMTPYERRNPDIIKRSRRERIARGSGTTIEDVNALIKQFTQMQRMMKQMMGNAKTKRGKRGGGGGADIDPQELLRMLNR
jgi:signal recognition particle subunit SRP54